MIFVCVGSREYQFNRLLKKVDELISSGEIKQEVFGQIGQSTYLPRNYKYQRFMSVEEFRQNQQLSELIISHGGTGALIGALKMEKKVIAVPRLAKYGEHIDDHQIQVAEVLTKEGYLKSVLDVNDLGEAIQEFNTVPIKQKYNKPSRVINIINDFIDG